VRERTRQHKRDETQTQVRQHDLQKNDKKDREIKNVFGIVRQGGKAKRTG
jgi:hypothetical protein